MSWNRRICTELVTDDHAYTSVDVPWEIDADSGRKLFRYLRSGGVRAFGSTSDEAARSRRQTRFLIFFAAVFLFWFILWIV
jgi:hypothetical protein